MVKKPQRTSILLPKDHPKSDRKVRFSERLFKVKEIPARATRASSDTATQDEEGPQVLSHKDRLLSWHLRLGHMPFGILRQAAKLGILPKNILAQENPHCPSCYYGKGQRRPWRRGSRVNHIAPYAAKPGDCVSVDQLISPIPGFVSQNSGRLTRKRYKVATVFVDHASRLGYVHVSETTDAVDAIEAKRAFENYAKTCGVTVKHYHADNGIFNARAFLHAVESANQTITFCGVGAHHQSGVAEHRIRELSELAHTQLLHAQSNNPKAITVHLWPYALRHANYMFNCLPRSGKEASPLEIFSGAKIRPNLEHLHPFGCPVYVTREELQDGKKLPKWEVRSRVGVNLGRSPHHAASVGLILNLTTGLVSPQYHCIYDDLI